MRSNAIYEMRSYQVPGARYLVPGTWYLVPGTWYLVPGTLYLVPAEMGHLFFNQKCDFGALEALFGYLGHHFGDPGVQGDTQWTH